MWIIIWLIIWVFVALAISFKTKSLTSILGGGFVGSLLVVMLIFAFQGKLLTGRNTYSGRNSQETSISKPAFNKPRPTSKKEVPKTAPNTGSTSINESVPIEHQLATINAGGYVSKDHISIARFCSLLNQLSSTYIDDKQPIADMSVKAKEILRENGIEESLLNIMEGMNQIFSRKIGNQKYAEYIAAYIALRVKGQSHTEAIRGLQAILQRMAAP